MSCHEIQINIPGVVDDVRCECRAQTVYLMVRQLRRVRQQINEQLQSPENPARTLPSGDHDLEFFFHHTRVVIRQAQDGVC
jgi:hypothetical protein